MENFELNGDMAEQFNETFFEDEDDIEYKNAIDELEAFREYEEKLIRKEFIKSNL